jgi:hypothetical protein
MQIRRLRPSEHAQLRALQARVAAANALAEADRHELDTATRHAVENMIFDALVALDEARRVDALASARGARTANAGPTRRSDGHFGGIELVRRPT